MANIINERVELARQGKNPTVVCKLPSGWLVMSDNQIVPGYCILLADPVAGSLNEMSEAERVTFLSDMARVGDAMLKVTGAYRINYEILGNTDACLHAHIVPRYMSEPEARRKMPVWFYDFNTAKKFDAVEDKELMEKLAAALR